MVWDHMAPVCLEHHPWKQHVVRTQTWVHPCSPVLLQSEVRQSWKISSFPDPLSFAYTTVVTIHKLAFFLLVAFLIKLVPSTKLVSSVQSGTDCRHYPQTNTHYYFCSLFFS